MILKTAQYVNHWYLYPMKEDCLQGSSVIAWFSGWFSFIQGLSLGKMAKKWIGNFSKFLFFLQHKTHWLHEQSNQEFEFFQTIQQVYSSKRDAE